MASAPALTPDVARRLRDINRNFYAKWNDRRAVWEIHDRTASGSDYIVVFATLAGGSLVPITGDREPHCDVYTHLRRGQWLRNLRDRQFRDHLRKLNLADEERQAAIEQYDRDSTRQFGLEAYRAFNMFAREQGYDSGKVKIPTIQGADITHSGVSI
jgi:hypothetical protein